jgi:dihydrofolate reductase
MHITLIAALDHNRVIGRQNKIPWDLPDDMRHFVQTTRGKPVIMGRSTWDGLWIKPLPKRLNIVVTRQPSLVLPEGVCVVHSPAEALALVAAEPEVMVIGGGDIYKTFLPLAHRLILTFVDAHTEDGDAFFPAWNPDEWIMTKRLDHSVDDRHALPFSIQTLERKSPPPAAFLV